MNRNFFFSDKNAVQFYVTLLKEQIFETYNDLQ